jgi:hypothetical protein
MTTSFRRVCGHLTLSHRLQPFWMGRAKSKHRHMSVDTNSHRSHMANGLHVFHVALELRSSVYYIFEVL